MLKKNSPTIRWYRHLISMLAIILGIFILGEFTIPEGSQASANFQSNSPSTKISAENISVLNNTSSIVSNISTIITNTTNNSLTITSDPILLVNDPLAPNADCSSVPNGSCVETRPGVNLCMWDSVCVVKVDLNNQNIRPKVVIAPNGGTAWLNTIASGASAIAAINGDFFSGCPDTTPPLNCGEGLTYIDGSDYTDYTGSEWSVRRSLGLNDNFDPNIGWPNEQGGYHWQTLGGGPQVTFGGEFRWRCWYQADNTYGNCSCDANNRMVINDEQFVCGDWWNREQSIVAFSEDRNTLYLAKSIPGVNRTILQMHSAIWGLGGRYSLKLDSGGSSGLYFNDGIYSFAWNGGRQVANAWVIAPYTSPACNPSSNEIALFVDPNYSGQCVIKGIGDYPNPSSIGLPNDSISSIRVGSNVQAVLCHDDNYSGGCETFTGDDSNLSDNSIGDNQVSSVRVENRGGSTETRLYDNTNYGGSSVYVNTTGLYTMVDVFNDMAESITMPTGWSVRLFEHDDYYGPQVCIQGNDGNLWDNYYNSGNVAANSATMFEVYNQSSCPPIVIPPSATPSPSSTPTRTKTPSPTSTLSPTRTRTPSPTNNLSPTRTPTRTPDISKNEKIFLPLINNNSGPIIKGIYGRVLVNGVPKSGIYLELRHWNGSTTSSIASTRTLNDGTYSFPDAPTLISGHQYYVRYLNETDPSKLFLWNTPQIQSYTAGSNYQFRDFDIANLFYNTPAPSAIVSLPTTFSWIRRASTPTDSYEFNILDWDTLDYLFWTNRLGYVSSYTLNNMPANIYPGTPYGWEIWIYGPDGGVGIAFYLRHVTFSSAGTSDMATSIFSSEPDKLIRLDEIVTRRQLESSQR